MNGCIYRTKDGECDLYREGGKFKAWCDPEHCDNIAPTNADWIRTMTDEELAEFLYVTTCEDGYPQFDTTQGWLNWLREEAKE